MTVCSYSNDFGKSRPIVNPKEGKKGKTKEEQDRFKKKYPHIALEIVEGRGAQSVASDIFSFANIVKHIYSKCKLEKVPEPLLKCLSADPREGPAAMRLLPYFRF